MHNRIAIEYRIDSNVSTVYFSKTFLLFHLLSSHTNSPPSTISMSKSVSVLRFINTSVKSRFSGTGAVRITASPPLSPLSTFFYSNTAAFSTTATFCKESDDKRYTKTIWKEQKPVDYNELKAITNSPNDVSPCLPMPLCKAALDSPRYSVSSHRLSYHTAFVMNLFLRLFS